MTRTERVGQEAMDLADAMRRAGEPLNNVLAAVAEHLHEALDDYNWVGFYLADGTEPWLQLGPYVGAATDHTRIPFGRGICGQVAESLRTFVVPDVTEQDNYLACSLSVRSEIVVPILVAGRFVAQIDIDSHRVERFGPADQAMLERLAAHMSSFFAE